MLASFRARCLNVCVGEQAAEQAGAAAAWEWPGIPLKLQNRILVAHPQAWTDRQTQDARAKNQSTMSCTYHKLDYDTEQIWSPWPRI